MRRNDRGHASLGSAFLKAHSCRNSRPPSSSAILDRMSQPVFRILLNHKVTMPLPGYKYDVFISYAQAIDHEGWVRRFNEKLTNYLGEILDGEPALFWDKRSLRPNDVLSDTVKQAVRESAVLVVIVSTKYLTRHWCQIERDQFTRSHGVAAARRMLLVRYDETPFTEFQKVLPECLGIEFFDSDGLPLKPDSRKYKLGLFRLRKAIKEELDSLIPKKPTTIMRSDNRPSVFVAVGNTDILDWRNQLLVSLDQFGVRTISPDTYFFMHDGFTETLAKQFDESVVFVQLLGDVPFPPPPQLSSGLERWLCEQAKARDNLGVMRWRKPAPLPTDPDWKAVVEESDVCGIEFSKFVENVAENAKRRHQDRLAKAKNSDGVSLPLVVVRADDVDDNAAKQVARVLASYNLDVTSVSPSLIGSMVEIAEQSVTGGIMVVFERSSKVLGRLQELRSFTSSEHFQRWVLGFWNAGAANTLRVESLRHVHIVDKGDPNSIERFVTDLRQKAAQR